MIFVKVLWTLWHFFASPLHDGPVDDIPYEATPFGPQSWREAHIAMKAIQGDHDDMRFHENGSESAGISNDYFRWPGYPGSGIVPYVIDRSLSNYHGLIKQAIEQYHKYTCIRFVPRTNQPDYINMIPHNGCYSYVGCQHRGPQPVSLGNGCMFTGTIVHELGHAIGLFHEHQRSDRDKFIHVYMNNVVSGQTHNFEKTNADSEIRPRQYDYTSIMHYGPFAFSRQPGQLKTMEAINGAVLREPFDKPGLNRNDVNLVNYMYKCN